MAQSLRNVHLHITFACKYRLASIEPIFREDLQEFLCRTAIGEGHYMEAVYAMPDHCHLLLRFGPGQSYADALRALKANSSRFIHEDLQRPDFKWQNSHAAYSVSLSHLDKVKSYIDRQPIIHAKRTFAYELDQILRISGEELSKHEQYRWINGI